MHGRAHACLYTRVHVSVHARTPTARQHTNSNGSLGEQLVTGGWLGRGYVCRVGVAQALGFPSIRRPGEAEPREGEAGGGHVLCVGAKSAAASAGWEPGSARRPWFPLLEETGELGRRGVRTRKVDGDAGSGHWAGKAAGTSLREHLDGLWAEDAGTLQPWCLIIAWSLHLLFLALRATEDLGGPAGGPLPRAALGPPCGQA